MDTALMRLVKVSETKNELIYNALTKRIEQLVTVTVMVTGEKWRKTWWQK